MQGFASAKNPDSVTKSKMGYQERWRRSWNIKGCSYIKKYSLIRYPAFFISCIRPDINLGNKSFSLNQKAHFHNISERNVGGGLYGIYILPFIVLLFSLSLKSWSGFEPFQIRILQIRKVVGLSSRRVVFSARRRCARRRSDQTRGRGQEGDKPAGLVQSG